ncbi:nicotinate-nucleotide--dimethylbenzimidazole phosphoribosyltransferase [Paenibacillus mesophilus]|uniref:nicotinate-nucleotide--dimethylbenzimidazole phosphoribosyltransferase n=1 Tax=Paenibacillus mesophilus TaxID=2582849 RepID=UPI00110EC188|nr:nicotinate-nucleotide--dimethylbenzimidazole phosphoribosyltransferase [Paenibacillus mesophilus]TMV44715.1 nicotinate-nucleotide--dimethylbenzimidazole phosphoribosyltransferase [Paenibacillus mesophilus]
MALRTLLEQTVERIRGLDESAMRDAEKRIDRLTKPPGSLGRLEEIARQIAGITGRLQPDLSGKAVIVMAGDHGVCAEGVSAFPAAVTPQMVLNFLNGGAAVNVLSRHVGADVVCVDIGVNADLSHPNLVGRKIRKGTDNIAVGPAMSPDEAVRAIQAGVDIVDDLAERGYGMFATGEMGIGNTTPSSALLAALTGMDIEAVVGRGTGIGDEALRHKRDVIRRALEVNRPNAEDALDVLAKVGGFEIAGLVGVILGAAANRCPVVIDGFISSAAALVASRIAPLASAYMLPSHLSHELGHRVLMEHIGLRPILQMDMRLGEGTGAVMAFPIVEAAVKLMNEMATFESAGVSEK